MTKLNQMLGTFHTDKESLLEYRKTIRRTLHYEFLTARIHSFFRIILKMPSAYRIILACAGSGKATTIVDHACTNTSRRAALTTYTINGADELVKIACQRHRAVPSHTVISTWYAFLLRHFIRPYQTQLYKPRVSRLLELVEHLLSSATEITLVGDNRQATYTTNDSGKNICEGIVGPTL